MALLNDLAAEAIWFRQTLDSCDKENTELMYEDFPIMGCKIASLLFTYHLLSKWPNLVILGIYGFAFDKKGNRNISHYWIEVNGIAIDITADQYNLLEDYELNEEIIAARPYDSVYVGPRHRLPQYQLFEIEEVECHLQGFPEMAEDFLDLMEITYKQLKNQ